MPGLKSSVSVRPTAPPLHCSTVLSDTITLQLISCESATEPPQRLLGCALFKRGLPSS